MDFQKIRNESLRKAKKLGYETNPALPLLDSSLSLRPVDEVISRSLALFGVVAGSYGFDKKSAISWIMQECATDQLAETEREFLVSGEGDSAYFQSQVEGLNAFAWALGVVKSMHFDSVCDNTLIKLFPDIKNGKSSSEYRDQSQLRSIEEILSVCDLAYCLHWAVRDADVNNRDLPGCVASHVIVERRRALEWMLTTKDWDEVSLDT